MKPSEVLSRAADLIEPEGAWTRFYLARDDFGEEVSPDSDDATCWCTAGALKRYAGAYSDTYSKARRYVIGLVDDGLIASWNDDPDRTQSEVVTALRQASELARSEGN